MSGAIETIDKLNSFNVGMAKIVVVKEEQIANAILGSCIALALYNLQYQLACVAHIVLSRASGTASGHEGKFADTAVPKMLQLLQERGLPTKKLSAKIAGGASMFEANGPFQVGKANFDVVCELLDRSRIPIEAQHVGGKKGRKITFSPRTGIMEIETIGADRVYI